MAINVPSLQYFTGGFILSGTYDSIPVNHFACGNVQKGLKNLMDNVLNPEAFTSKVKQLDKMMDKAYNENPELKQYTMKPSEMLDMVSNEGLSGLGRVIVEKKDNIFEDPDFDIMKVVQDAMKGPPPSMSKPKKSRFGSGEIDPRDRKNAAAK
mmetsp:Transcript_42032/g.64395  ORF Transcript_42032/g.64395 Transcript_42032/m.64395 type:complete len:153 (+) Transcript_42032:1785-2243(+)